MGGDAPHTPRPHRSRGRSAYATPWRLVGTYWLDTVGHGPESRPGHHRKLRTRFNNRPLLSLAEPLLLRSAHFRRADALCVWRLGCNALGSVSPRYAVLACNMARQFGYTPVGKNKIRNR